VGTVRVPNAPDPLVLPLRIKSLIRRGCPFAAFEGESKDNSDVFIGDIALVAAYQKSIEHCLLVGLLRLLADCVF